MNEERHYAALTIPEGQLRALINAPAGTRVISVWPEPLQRTITVILEGEGLPLCNEGEEPQKVTMISGLKSDAEGHGYLFIDFKYPEREYPEAEVPADMWGKGTWNQESKS